jgi:hypothetical protein
MLIKHVCFSESEKSLESANICLLSQQQRQWLIPPLFLSTTGRTYPAQAMTDQCTPRDTKGLPYMMKRKSNSYNKKEASPMRGAGITAVLGGNL